MFPGGFVHGEENIRFRAELCIQDHPKEDRTVKPEHAKGPPSCKRAVVTIKLVFRNLHRWCFPRAK
jgi:hypothetical protein